MQGRKRHRTLEEVSLDLERVMNEAFLASGLSPELAGSFSPGSPNIHPLIPLTPVEWFNASKAARSAMIVAQCSFNALLELK